MTEKENKITPELLQERQAWPLERKIQESWHRLEQWYNYWRMEGKGVYVSFSGGKDSTVLLDLVRSNPFLHNADIPAVFVDTGLEYPEVREFVKTFPDVVWLKPKMPFNKVIEKYGYPVVSKEVSQFISEVRNTKSDKLREKRMNGDCTRLSGETCTFKSGKIPDKWKYLIDAPFKISHKCCDVMKKEPFRRYERETGRKAITGIMAEDSMLRKQMYMRSGCQSFEGKIQSNPMMFWVESDIWQYIREKNLPYSKVYDQGADRTGCMFCMFGLHMEKGENRIQRIERTHPQVHKYCMNQLGMKEVLDFMGMPYKHWREDDPDAENQLFDDLLYANKKER